jgi:hypothetical protein
MFSNPLRWVTPLSTLRSNNFASWLGWGMCGVVLIWIVINSALALSLTRALRHQEIHTAGTRATQLRLTLQPLWLLGGTNPTILTGKESLELLALLPSTLEQGQVWLRSAQDQVSPSDPTYQAAHQELLTLLPEWRAHLESWQHNARRSWIVTALLKGSPGLKQLVTDDRLVPGLSLAQQLLEGEHRWIILLQNTDEVRATGGFMGSFIDLQLVQGLPTQVAIKDIYDVDGQFTGTITAPPGANEYLSSGRGLRLPDANWWPDFPTSSQTILRYFAQANEASIDGVAVVNLSLAESVLGILGPVYLPDHNVNVTHQNIHQVARSDRANFFPGSRQKTNFLTQLATHVRLKLIQSSALQQRQLLDVFLAAPEQREVQAYSPQPTQQALLGALGVTGELFPRSDLPTVAWIESNVGINKLSRYIQRTQSVGRLSPVRFHWSSELSNTFDQAEQPYVAYQRLLLPAGSRLLSVTVGGETVKWDSTTGTTAAGQTYQEFGWLITVKSLSRQPIEVEFELPQASDQLLVRKQAGIPAFPLTIKTERPWGVVVERDIEITW